MLTIEEKKQRKKKYMKTWREKNREAIAEYAREWHKNNRETILERSKEYRKNNREAILKSKREYYKNNREALLERSKEYFKEWYKNNGDTHKEYVREYSKNNREVINKYKNNRYSTDLNYKMRENLRNVLHNKLKRHLIKETTPEFSYTKSSLSYLGCTVEELKTHIENQFEDGMTWENWTRDGWHLDHIIPCSSFDLTKKKEQEKCFHYTNLQPLWAEDNMSKGSKLNWDKKELVV